MSPMGHAAINLDDFSPEAAETSLRQLASSAPFLPVSTRTPGGIERWLGWLSEALALHRSKLQPSPASATAEPHGHAHGRSPEARSPEAP